MTSTKTPSSRNTDSLSVLERINVEPVISVKEARKVMGKVANRYTDKQLIDLVNRLDMIVMLQFGIVPK